ncbi:class I SAM-dependent methyltransferase [Tepidiforma sp.]|uniref:class I SAM-dependent methyltransferase n=1 Tax=Tepidiforma sp. TaxID=2682230 RepID=UPI002ADE77AF|nr:class I SAM-dependent methyltransferase [Tepidiforma sp.]
MGTRPAGQVTRGKTAPNRLRLVDTYLAVAHADVVRGLAGPVVDLGFGDVPVTTIELLQRLRRLNGRAEVVGVEIDPERAERAQGYVRAGLRFVRGGFELPLAPGERAGLVRAFNVLRQYPVDGVRAALEIAARRMAPGALLIEGTCDVWGRLACWWIWERTSASLVPPGRWEAPPLVRRRLVFGARLRALAVEGPRAFQPFLPRELIHHVEPGGMLDGFFGAWERAWLAAAGRPLRERWRASVLAAGEVVGVDRRRTLIDRGLAAFACDGGLLAEVVGAGQSTPPGSPGRSGSVN